MKLILLPIILFSFLLISCNSDDSSGASTEPQLIISFQFDANAERQNNLGEPVNTPNGNTA